MKLPTATLFTLAAFCQAGDAATHARFDLSSPAAAPFPSNAFTVVAPQNITGLQVNLPLPDCGLQSSQCDDLRVVNQMDGFNVQARLSIPFDGAIDPASINSSTVFLVQLTPEVENSTEAVIGINQIIWDPQSNTVYAESDEMLEQHTTYALVVTSGVLDQNGQPVHSSAEFGRFRELVSNYRLALEKGVRAAARIGVEENRIVAVSVFTTQTVTAVLEKSALSSIPICLRKPAFCLARTGRERSSPSIRSRASLGIVRLATTRRHSRNRRLPSPR